MTLGYQNQTFKRVGVSKLRLMAGGSVRCVVCDKTLRKNSDDGNHKCAEHLDWEMIVTDVNDSAVRKAAIARLHEKDSDEL
jgi:hypothetical protein